jgi:hypothetical protein
VKQKLLRPLYRWSFSHKRYIVAAAFAVVMFLLFTEQIKALLVLTVFGIASSFISLYKRIVRLPPALELITFTTVLVTLVYGPIVAAIYAVVVTFSSEIVSGYPDEMTLTYIPSRLVMIAATYMLQGMEIVALGIWMVLVFNAVQQPIFWMLTDVEKRIKSVYFIVLNIPLSIIIFKVAGPTVLALMWSIR